MVRDATFDDFVDGSERAPEVRREAIRLVAVGRIRQARGLDEYPVELVFADEANRAVDVISRDEAFAVALVRVAECLIAAPDGTLRVAAKIERAAVSEAKIFQNVEELSARIRGD